CILGYCPGAVCFEVSFDYW
nr:immunoglobulin heavy chain junction region [Macaca mulatta]